LIESARIHPVSALAALQMQKWVATASRTIFNRLQTDQTLAIREKRAYDLVLHRSTFRAHQAGFAAVCAVPPDPPGGR
jgi:hypothetical protein